MYKVNIEHIGDLVFRAKTDAAEFIVDAKVKEGMSPPDVLLASIGSCIGVYIQKYAQGSKLPLENLSINVEAEFTKDPPTSFRVINVSIDLKGAQLDEHRKMALLEFVKNCPVHNTLKGQPQVEIRINGN